MSDTDRPQQRHAVPSGWLVLATLLLLVPLLAACGGDDDDSPTATAATGAASPTSQTTSPTASAATDASPSSDATDEPGTPTGDADTLMGVEIEAAAHEGGTFIEGTAADLQTVNPVIANDTPSVNFLSLIFESLVELDRKSVV